MVTWSLVPLHGENAVWLSVFYQRDSQDIIKEIWRDIGGLTSFGHQRFNQSLKVLYKKNQEFSVILTNIEDSMNLYLTLIFMNAEGEIKGGPLLSKASLNVKGTMTYKIHSEGCNDDPNTCGHSEIIVNEQKYDGFGRGMTFVLVNASTGEYQNCRSFDWYADSTACQRSLQWLQSSPKGTTVFGAIRDEGTVKYNDQCEKALLLIGGKKPFQRQSRGSFAIVGYLGDQKPLWIGQNMSAPGKGPTILSGQVPLIC
ncbi:protein FAM3A-like [Clytia hemisphaerica]